MSTHKAKCSAMWPPSNRSSGMLSNTSFSFWTRGCLHFAVMSELTWVVSGDRKRMRWTKNLMRFSGILPRKRCLFQKLGFLNPWLPPLLIPSGTSVGDGAAGLTPYGMAVGSGTGTPPWMHVLFLPPFLASWTVTTRMTLPSTSNTMLSGSSRVEEDIVEQLNDSKTRTFKDFGPSVEPEGTWEPSAAMKLFLERHFNHILTDRERMPEFPKPNCSVLQVLSWMI